MPKGRCQSIKRSSRACSEGQNVIRIRNSCTLGTVQVIHSIFTHRDPFSIILRRKQSFTGSCLQISGMDKASGSEEYRRHSQS